MRRPDRDMKKMLKKEGLRMTTIEPTGGGHAFVTATDDRGREFRFLHGRNGSCHHAIWNARAAIRRAIREGASA